MTKQYLQQYLWCVQEQKRLESRIAAIRDEIEGIRGVIVSDMPKGGGRDNERLEKLIDLKQDLIDEYREQIKQGHIVMTNIETALHRLSDERFRTLLSMRYLDGHSWEYIAEYMKYDERYIYKLHGWSLQALKKI